MRDAGCRMRFLLDLDDPRPPVDQQVLRISQYPIGVIADHRRDPEPARAQAGVVDRQHLADSLRGLLDDAVRPVALGDPEDRPLAVAPAGLAVAAAERLLQDALLAGPPL